jgi:hypothetical protein
MESKDKKTVNRREVIKKAAKTGAFILPTIITFEVQDLHAQASGGNGFPSEPNKPAVR